MPDTVQLSVYSFADNTKISKLINDNKDRNVAKGLQRMEKWGDTWLLKFHPNKCKYLYVGKNDPKSNYQNILMGTALERINKEKDMGVIVHDKRSCEKHKWKKWFLKSHSSVSSDPKNILKHW